MSTLDMVYIIIIYGLSILLQGVVVYYGWRMSRLVKWLSDWTPAWLVFTAGSGIIFLRRIIWTIEAVKGCPTTKLASIGTVVESFLTIGVSCLMLVFVFILRRLFQTYIKTNGIVKE